HRLDLLHSVDFIPPHRGARRHVITVHDLTFLHYPQHKDRAARRYYNDQIAWAVRRADHILAVSEATRQDLITMLSVPADRITVQPHGVDPRYQPQSVEAVRLLGLPNTYLLHVGTLEPRKNIPALLDAYTRLDDPPPLVLAGQVGWLFDETLARIKQMQADHVPVILRDDIADAALPALYSGALALVIPSFYEGFGLPALEAMACGTPVIASNTSSLPEVVGDAGRLIDPQDVEALAGALRVATTDAGWRGEASTRGLARAAAFTWARSARIALDVYHRVLES
ncbi:MAG: glycosyltransferase family 4 protein, partial [Chloroflexota bacterium]